MTPMRMHVTRRNFVLGGAAVGLGGCAYLLTPNILGSQPLFDLPDKPSGFRDTAGRELVAANLANQRTGVFLATGQSLAGDHVQGFYQPRHEVLNFNIYDGRLYRYISIRRSARRSRQTDTRAGMRATVLYGVRSSTS
jgi:hypothetical protein